MRSMGIRSKVAKKFKVTTNSSHNEPIAHNLLDQVFEADFVNDAWTSDLTYVWTGSGWLYLTVIMDLYNREIIGHSFSKRMTAETTVNPALDMALMHRKPAPGVVIHSDRGIQYASKSFRERLEKHGLIQSMSGKGNCYDNAVTETFFKTLKTELVYTEHYRTREEARNSLFEYIEVFYNRKRKHSALGYKSPVEYLRYQQQPMVMAS
jgi:putative transposase